LMQIQ
jgi:bifunctional DNase/RNase